MKKTAEEKSLTPEEKEAFKDFCVNQDWPNAGEFIDELTAARGHKKWREDNLISGNMGNDVKRHAVVAGYFSKAKLEQLLAKQDCFGVRIYFCKSRGRIGNRRSKKYRDLFLMPTGKDGVDLFAIKEYVRTEPGEPVPHDEKTGLPLTPLDKNGERLKVDQNGKFILKDKNGQDLLHDDNGKAITALSRGILNASTPCPDHCSQFCQK